ncbi:hypothetical protein BTR22_04360 [Alkalihalophilus pseudofirmus]|uniref:hypothetical protein n=1 Tax=Alkalihalophilus pseudofirmus TaxID=79885 RepID=UPI000952F504|nr:hypothetical protein BTR22_04360 [Alkalihalophilus pseudofirmus]
MEIEKFLDDQTSEIIEKFKGHPLNFLVAASSFKEMEKYANRTGGKIEKFGRVSYIVTTESGNYELFTKAKSPSYRKIFKRFIECKYSKPFKIPKEIEVDHLYNKKRFPDHYVRLLLLPRNINGDWGRFTERQLTFMEKVNGGKSEYYLDYLIFLKAVQYEPYMQNIEINTYVSKAINYMQEKELLGNETTQVKYYLNSELTYIVTGEFNYPTLRG